MLRSSFCLHCQCDSRFNLWALPLLLLRLLLQLVVLGGFDSILG